jgi:XRE family aerobic/anaerobic benzoate catabolism transcriptional regulator
MVKTPEQLSIKKLDKAPELEDAQVISEDLEGQSFLSSLGKRVREARSRRGETRKLVARNAGVSERHLAHLEAGEGNISIVLLRRIAQALEMSIQDLLIEEDEDTAEKRLVRRFLSRLPAHRVEELVFRLMRDFGSDEAVRRERIALIGLRGAGKSTLGQKLAKELNLTFVELDEEVQKETGMPSAELFSLYGQGGYRRIERRVMEKIISGSQRVVISVGGGVVSEAENYDYLLANCYTVWVKAQPEEHMARVVAQGDLRPMAGNDEAMKDLKNILDRREPLYARADGIVDTSGESVEKSYAKLRSLVLA